MTKFTGERDMLRWCRDGLRVPIFFLGGEGGGGVVVCLENQHRIPGVEVYDDPRASPLRRW